MSFLATISHTPRFAELIGAMIKFGFDEFVVETGLIKIIPTQLPFVHKKIIDKRAINQPIEVRLRLLLEHLGPTFIKLGQILSTRSDLIPHEMAVELKKLQDDCPQLEFDVIKERLETKFEKPLTDLFNSVERKPLAAGSLAQVHRATLKDGSRVVLKVIRPKARRLIDADMAILDGLAQFVEHHFSELGYSPIRVVKEISKQINKELDLVNEGKNAERLRKFFSDSQSITFPKVYWKTSTRDILTMEEVQGVPLSSINPDDLAIEERRKIVANGADAVYGMCLEFGLFHADPHPGNIFVMPNSALCFIDCGMTGQIDDRTLGQLAELVGAVLSNDTQKVVSIVVALTQADPNLETDRDFRETTWEIITRFHVKSLKKLDLINLINSLFEALREYDIRCPADLVYLIKAMATIQGVGQDIDPTFDILAHVNPLIHRMIYRQCGPSAILNRFLRGLINYVEMIEDLPEELHAIFVYLRQRHFKIRLELDHLVEFKRTVERSSKLIALSVLVSSIIIGSASLARVSGWRFIIGIGVIGLILGCACCVVLLAEMFHGRK